jgi:hypothetical protein
MKTSDFLFHITPYPKQEALLVTFCQSKDWRSIDSHFTLEESEFLETQDLELGWPEDKTFCFNSYNKVDPAQLQKHLISLGFQQTNDFSNLVESQRKSPKDFIFYATTEPGDEDTPMHVVAINPANETEPLRDHWNFFECMTLDEITEAAGLSGLGTSVYETDNLEDAKTKLLALGLTENDAFTSFMSEHSI